MRSLYWGTIIFFTNVIVFASRSGKFEAKSSPGSGEKSLSQGIFFSIGITLSGLVCLRQLYHFWSGTAGERVYWCYEFACILSPKCSRNVEEMLGLKCNNLIRVCMPSAGYYRPETVGYFIMLQSILPHSFPFIPCTYIPRSVLPYPKKLVVCFAFLTSPNYPIQIGFKPSKL